jgi:hypothetical protein
MWGRLERRRRRRTGRGEALKESLSALKSVRRRDGRSRSRRGIVEKAYGDTVGLGIGILAMVLTVLLLLWLVRRLTSENAPPDTEVPEGSVEEVPPEQPN